MRNGMNDIRGQRRSEKQFYRNRAIDILRWDGLQLRLKSGRLLATVEPDSKWPKMFRVRLPNGHLTDMVNLSRATLTQRHARLIGTEIKRVEWAWPRLLGGG
jgi:hypothetical protein